MRLDIKEKIFLPNEIEAEVKEGVVTIKGSNGELSRNFAYPGISIFKDDSTITLESKKSTKTEKRMIRTYKAHIKNMLKGVSENHEYKLKICAGHFPISVEVKDNIVEIKNFLGERKSRVAKIFPNVKVDVSGDIITVTGIGKEDVAQTAANIEQATRITGKDKRRFMDRINMISKDGKLIQ